MKRPKPPTPEELAELERLGALQFTPEDTARILGRPDIARAAAEYAEGQSPAGQAYQRGRLLAEVELRTTLLSLAKEGSLPHAKQMLSFVFGCRAAVERSR